MSHGPPKFTPDPSDADGEISPRDTSHPEATPNDQEETAGGWKMGDFEIVDLDDEDDEGDEDDELAGVLADSDGLDEADLEIAESTGEGDPQMEELDMEVFDITEDEARDGYIPLTIETSRGDIACRFYEVPNAVSAVIWVGGVGGGFDSPAKDLYPRLCADLQARGIASLRIQYRQPTELEECVLDVLAGLGVLGSEDINALALVGHSLGGAVVIQAGTASDAVRAVVTLATQSYGAADVVDDLPEDCAILLAHGSADPVLPPESSEYVYSLAHEPRRLLIYEGAGHVLDEVADQVTEAVREFLIAQLAA